MWQRYIRWIDRDLGNGWPKMNGLSSLMPFVSLALAVVYDFFVHPNEKPGTIEGTIVSVRWLLWQPFGDGGFIFARFASIELLGSISVTTERRLVRYEWP